MAVSWGLEALRGEGIKPTRPDLKRARTLPGVDLLLKAGVSDGKILRAVIGYRTV